MDPYNKKNHFIEVTDNLCALYQTNRATYHSLVSLYTKMSNGCDGGQFEPWNPIPLRTHYYKTWSDNDFSDVLDLVSKTLCPEENID